MRVTVSNKETYVSPELSIISMDIESNVCSDYREIPDVDGDNDLGEI